MYKKTAQHMFHQNLIKLPERWHYKIESRLETYFIKKCISLFCGDDETC